MKIVKKKVVVFLDIAPVDHESEKPTVFASTWSGNLQEGHTRKAFEVEIDVPVRWEALPVTAVQPVTV